jgi:DNA-directed RNA polymerase subunit RPC12/RpoP
MKPIKFFIISAGGILLGASLVRFIVALEHMQVLAVPEPLLGIPLRHTVFLVGICELVVALICLFGRSLKLQLIWLFWLLANYFTYRIILHFSGIHPQGTCIGSLNDPLHLHEGNSAVFFGLLPYYLLFISLLALCWFWRESRIAKSANQLKMSCPTCGGHVKFAAENVGTQIPCPHCSKSLKLRRDENLKISCFFCQGHIEFPSHALGTKIPCPHCKMDITLKESA